MDDMYSMRLKKEPKSRVATEELHCMHVHTNYC